jgi:hypothetical protein
MRFITAASFVAFGGLIGVGVPVLLVSERPLVAKADISDSPAAPCKQQAWLQFDRNCLSKRDLPWTAGRGVSSTSTVDVRAEPDPAPEQPLTDSRHAAAATPESVPQEAMSGTPMSPAPGSWEPVLRKSTPPDFVLQGLAPQEPASQKPAPQEPVARQAATPEPMTPEPATQPPTLRRHRTVRAAPLRSAALEQRGAKSSTDKSSTDKSSTDKPATDTQASLPAAKKPIRSSRVAKRSTNEALNVVRRFGDSPRDIPVSAYAGNGTRVGGRPGLPLDIRPTSIQDVYYYSVPR